MCHQLHELVEYVAQPPSSRLAGATTLSGGDDVHLQSARLACATTQSCLTHGSTWCCLSTASSCISSALSFLRCPESFGNDPVRYDRMLELVHCLLAEMIEHVAFADLLVAHHARGKARLLWNGSDTLHLQWRHRHSLGHAAKVEVFFVYTSDDVMPSTIDGCFAFTLFQQSPCRFAWCATHSAQVARVLTGATTLLPRMA